MCVHMCAHVCVYFVCACVYVHVGRVIKRLSLNMVPGSTSQIFVSVLSSAAGTGL